MADTSPLDKSAEEFGFFDDCCIALIAKRYAEAALILEKGLKENSDKVHAVDQSDLLQRFLARLVFLRGEDEADAPAPQIKPLHYAWKPNRELLCSFCGKRQHKVRNLIAGPTVYICNECIEICNEIIEDQNEANR
jgi:hypothetical protein